MEEKDLNLLDEEKAIATSNSWLTQRVFNNVNEQMYQRGTFTVYIIHAAANGRQYEGVGFSKARPDIPISQYDPEKGRSVSRGRAVHDLFQEYKKDIKE